MTPTDEQTHILNVVSSTSDNVMVRALAGTGKTTTLEMIVAASPQQPTLCLAFNKKIAEEMTKRLPSTALVRTFNSLGHRIWASAVGKVALDKDKTRNAFRFYVEALDKSDRPEAWEVYHEVVSAVGLAKSLGYIPHGQHHSRSLLTQAEFHAALDERPSPLAAELIDTLLTGSIKASYQGVIDFNDQIYMPALFGGSFPRFPHVLVDEAQDLSPTNHEMLRRLAKGRVTIVGDPWQSIYGFRGAVQGGMEELQKRFAMTVCDLSVSFRCPSEIVKAVHWQVPHFKSTREGGIVHDLETIKLSEIAEDSTVICRNNAPLLTLAMRLLSAKRSVSVSGSDIGPRIIGTFKKLGQETDDRERVLEAIAEWEKVRREKGSKSAGDVADCMRVFASFGESLGQAIAYAEHLFKQEGTIRLTTGHKAKGLEWDTVYHLDPWLLNGTEQDLNLAYVIGTRARERLYTINSRNIT